MMKKTVILVLAAVMVIAMAVPAFAVSSPTAPVADEDKTTPLPEIVGPATGCAFYSIYEADQLPEKARKEFLAAYETLEEATPENMTVKYFFYHVKDSHLHGLCRHTFNIGEFEKVIVKQYVDEEWIELEELGKRMGEPKEVIDNSDGTITVVGLETAPTAFFIQ